MMSGGAMSAQPLTVSGDVGFLADENAQRLVSIYTEEVMDTLQCLQEAVDARLRESRGACPRVAFERGLTVMRQCPVEALAEQVSAMQARYPETDVLHRYVLVSLLSEAAYAETMTSLVLPTIAETYHAFARRVAMHPDLKNGPAFLGQPLASRRVVFLDAFRNAMHDQAQRYANRQVTARPNLRSGGSFGEARSAASRAPGSPGTLQAALQAARSRASGSDTRSRSDGADRLGPVVGAVEPRPDVAADDGSSREVLLVDTPVPPAVAVQSSASTACPSVKASA